MYGKQRNHTARGWDVASLYLTGDECNPKTPTRRLRGPERVVMHFTAFGVDLQMVTHGICKLLD